MVVERFDPSKIHTLASALFLAGAAIHGTLAVDAHNDSIRAIAQAEVYELKGGEARAQSLRSEAASAGNKSGVYVLIAGSNIVAGGLSAATGIMGAARRRRQALTGESVLTSRLI